jgi:hypothetical protein
MKLTDNISILINDQLRWSVYMRVEFKQNAFSRPIFDKMRDVKSRGEIIELQIFEYIKS